MKLLAIETSCDETAAAVVASSEDGQFVKLLSHSLATSLAQHATTGGIIPENAARAQIQFIIPTIYDALEKAGLTEGVTRVESGPKGSSLAGQAQNKRQDPDRALIPDIDAIAVTYGPGLIGSLLVGVETAKTLSYIWNKPLIPVNHLFGHMYANWVVDGSTSDVEIPDEKPRATFHNLPAFPAIVLIVSGGHTDLLLMKSHTDVTWLGGTRDDAAGEAFDKIGRILGLSYPAGPVIEERAKLGNPKAYHFPRPLAYDGSFDFSFSGLKTAVLREALNIKGVARLGRPQNSSAGNEVTEASFEGADKRSEELASLRSAKKRQDPDFQQTINNLARGTQDAIIDVLVKKTLNAAEKFQVKSIILSGGVAANQTLRDTFLSKLKTNDQRPTTKFFSPPKNLCTDNAAMIGAAAIFRNQTISWENLSADPQLYFD